MSIPNHVFIGLPVYASLNDKFALSLLRTFSQPPCRLSISMLSGDSLVCRARNNLAADFLEGDCSHLLFLDTDLEFSVEAIHRLIKHDLPIVGGTYYQKRHDRRIPILNAIAGEAPDENGMMRVRHVGTGMMLIAREVFEAVKPLVPVYHTSDDEKHQRHQWDFFRVGAHDDGKYESEDWAFCRLAREAGFDVWCDTRVTASHHGLGVYPCEPVEQLRRKVEAALLAARAMPDGPAKDELLACLQGEITEASRR